MGSASIGVYAGPLKGRGGGPQGTSLNRASPVGFVFPGSAFDSPDRPSSKLGPFFLNGSLRRGLRSPPFGGFALSLRGHACAWLRRCEEASKRTAAMRPGSCTRPFASKQASEGIARDALSPEGGASRNKPQQGKPCWFRFPRAGLRASSGLPVGNETAPFGAACSLAERGGFEPPVQFNPYGSLANYWFKPLTHLSNSGGKYNRLFQLTAIPEGFEPSAACLEGRCSIQLSYGTRCKELKFTEPQGHRWMVQRAPFHAGQRPAKLREIGREGRPLHVLNPMAATQKGPPLRNGPFAFCRGGQIRTDDLLLPKQARYRATLRPEKLGCKERVFTLAPAIRV